VIQNAVYQSLVFVLGTAQSVLSAVECSVVDNETNLITACLM